MRSSRDGWGSARRMLGPALLMVIAPVSAILVWHTHVALGGSLAALAHELGERGIVGAVIAICGPVFFGSVPAWAMIAIFVTTELLLLRLRAGGVAAFAITLALFLGGAYGLHLFSPTIAYDHFGAIIGALNLSGLTLCLGLYLKGRFAPSTRDVVLTGNPLVDYFWGIERDPVMAGFNVKLFTNCRFALMAWPLIILSFAAAQQARHGLSDSMMVAVGLQLVYVAKFFWWEPGYLRSLDIMHYRAGFFICWGCVVWVPAIYTASTLYLVDHPHTLGTPLAAAIFLLGVLAIVVNYLADAQRQRVRATDGRCDVWGKPPALIRARYTGERGEPAESVLLVSGFWGVARHFHYVPELVAAFCWTLPVLFHHALPWLYVPFLLALLVKRAVADDARCAAKYGSAWSEYRQRVPYQIVPGLF